MQAIEAPGRSKLWTCGTLTYTKVGLLSLFAFLLWGDFVIRMMDTVIPSIIPLKLKDLGASNVVIGLFLTSIPSFMAVVMTPYISFKSDRFRSKWGRRIPFILTTLPFLCLCMLALAFTDDISSWLHARLAANEISLPTLTIAVLGILFVAYNFFHMFVGSVFWYIFNDVVPVSFLGRFIGMMSVVGGIASFLYNYFIFKYAESHMKEIFLGTTLLYFLGVGMMCFFVKEGEYPPVTEESAKRSRGFEALKTFFRESFSHRLYILKYLFRGACFMSIAATTFNIFFLKEMGLSLEYIGKAAAVMSIAGIAVSYFVSIFVDRWHPLRILTYSTVFTVVFTASNWVWLFVTLPPLAFFWLYMLGVGLITTCHTLLSGLASLPMDMRLSPKSRFGQFCSAQAIIFHIGNILGGLGIGIFFDVLKRFFHGSDYIYRFSFAWNLLWTVVAALFICLLYRLWQRMGGDMKFNPPAPWTPEGVEVQDQAPFVGVQTRWLNLSLLTMRLLMLLSLLYLLPVSYWLWNHGWTTDLKWHLAALLPLSLGVLVWWVRVELSIRKDVARIKAGQSPLDGIPHHGVFFIKACALLLSFGVWVAMTVIALQSGLKGEVLVLGFGNVVTNVLALGAILVLRRIERGYDPMLDYDGRRSPQQNPPRTEASEHSRA